MVTFSADQWAQFDRAAQAQTFEAHRKTCHAARPDVAHNLTVAIRDALHADLAGQALHEATVADLFFMSFDLGAAITRNTDFQAVVGALQDRFVPFEEVVQALAAKRRRDAVIG